MLRAYKYRLLPTKLQADYLLRTMGCARFVYNALLADYKRQLDQYRDGDVRPKIAEVSSLKKDSPWLSEADSLALANAKKNLVSALSNFWQGRKGKRRGRKTGFPKMHGRHKSRMSFTTNNQNGTVRTDGDKILLPKIKWIRFIRHRDFSGTIRSVTVSRERDGGFFVSILCDADEQAYAKNKNTDNGSLRVVGLDMSYSDFVVDSDCTVPDGMKPKYVRQYRKNEKRRARLCRRMSRKKPGSSNRAKARLKIASLDRHIADSRKDFCHKVSKYYASGYDAVVIEDIDMQRQSMSGMRGHGKSVNDLGFGLFREYLRYKCRDYGTELFVADKWFASSKTCGTCGNKNANLGLSDRKWKCPVCGAEHDRDCNAACNLRDYYLKRINTAGTAGIHACGDTANTSGETLRQAASGKQEAADLVQR